MSGCHLGPFLVVTPPSPEGIALLYLTVGGAVAARQDQLTPLILPAGPSGLLRETRRKERQVRRRFWPGCRINKCLLERCSPGKGPDALLDLHGASGGKEESGQSRLCRVGRRAVSDGFSSLCLL